MSRKQKDNPVTAVPEEFISEMKTHLGDEEGAALIEAIEGKPSVSIRLNRRKISDTEKFMQRFRSYSPSPVEWCGSGFYLEERPEFIVDPLLHAGVYYVQEAASMVYETILNNLLTSFDLDIAHDGRPLYILDLCAAPGGKTTAMLNAVTGDYLLVANEFDGKRVKILKENLDKWGDPNVIITNSPTDKYARLEGCFDVVAVDAPCSGEGMMRREPIARSQWSHKLTEQCAALQKDILQNAVNALRPGGILIYSTCTFNVRENEENVGWLKGTFGMEPLDEPRHFMPHRERCEGLFVGVFMKPTDDGSNIMPKDRVSLLAALKKAGIRIVADGTEKTVMKGDMEIPSSRKVLAYDFDRGEFPEVELSLEDARSYLRRNALVLPPETPKGFVTVCYEGHPLGLVKNLGNRANNLYPAEWRIWK